MEAPIELNNVQFAVFWQLAAKKLNYKVDLADAMSVNDDPDTGAFINHWTDAIRVIGNPRVQKVSPRPISAISVAPAQDILSVGGRIRVSSGALLRYCYHRSKGKRERCSCLGHARHRPGRRLGLWPDDLPV
jgi:hypothetical protein